MKTKLTIIILTLTACSNITNKNEDILNTVGEREYIDSANFSIIRGKYVSGTKYIEVYENKKTKLDNWKEYYENGLLKEEGIMTNAKHIYVGIWKYYSNSGKIDSIIDYDKKHVISYFAALKMAEKKGFKMPEIEVSLYMDSLNTYWQIAKWTENDNQGGQTAEAILIDAKTGKIMKPKYELKNIY